MNKILAFQSAFFISKISNCQFAILKMKKCIILEFYQIANTRTKS